MSWPARHRSDDSSGATVSGRAGERRCREKRFDNGRARESEGRTSRRRVADAGRHTPNALATLVSPTAAGWRETRQADLDLAGPLIVPFTDHLQLVSSVGGCH